MAWLIIILALLLRLVLFNQSLWLDESIEALALMGKMGPILHYALYDFQPPLYHLILLGWTRVAGYSEIALRLPSLLSGLGVVWFTLKIGELLGGKKVGRVAGLLAATNPLLIYYSQEGRTYEMTAFFVTGSFYYLLLLLKKNNHFPHNSLFFILYSILSLWTSYIAWIVVGLQAIYLVCQKKFGLLKYLVLSSLTLLFWLPSFLGSLGIGLSTTVSSPEWGRVVGGISLKALALTWVKMNIGRISFDNNFFYGSLVALIFLLHAFILKSIKKTNAIIILWLIGPVVVTSLISLFVPVYSYFRVLFIVPAYLLILSFCLAKSSQFFTVALIAIQLLSLFYFWLTPRFHKEDWRSLTKYLNAQSASSVGMPSLNQSAPLTYYHLDKPLFEPKLGTSGQPNDVYYLRYVEDLFDTGKKGSANLKQAGYTVVQEKSFVGLQLVKYEKTSN